MAKVFTIAPGLENMGALKSGGQGSVYKGRRTGEIITAIKLLPTPIYSESENDKNYRDFQNEVQKLKKVNEEPNPNVVKIISFGLSETGNFPFIEMAYIEGPDLEELLKPPHDPVFTVKEVIKVAEQLSNALSHCHKVGVRHGDIKSNNVKYNLHTGNYVLLDFGLAIMSDEQRRTSLRRAGAVEFMAPEQNEGQMLFETDVYSFGVVIFELLAGRVPFPLEDKGETARNHVRLAHLETPPPDVVTLRRQNLPGTWSADKKDREMLVPDWLLTLVYRCLKKKPEDRFSNGIDLHEFIAYNSVHASPNINPVQSGLLQEQREKLQRESIQLNEQLLSYKDQLSKREKELIELRAALKNRENELQSVEPAKGYQKENVSPKKGVSRTAFVLLLLLTIGLAAFSAFSFLKNNSAPDKQSVANSSNESNSPKDTGKTLVRQAERRSTQRRKDSLLQVKHVNDSTKRANKRRQAAIDSSRNLVDTGGNKNADNSGSTTPRQDSQNQGSNRLGKYKAINIAYFYDQPDQDTRREGVFINKWNAAVVAQDDLNGFIYVVYTNEKKQTTRGWLLKKDLQRLQ
jgi:serine/threonine protein kinase